MRPGRRLAFLLLAALLLGAGSPEPIPDASTLLGWVKTLADPALDGRASGTPGAERAARLIAEEFRRLGLRHGGDGGGYLQAFEVVTGIRVGGPNTLEVAAGDAIRSLDAGSDFLPYAFSESGEAEGELVFAGYGQAGPGGAWSSWPSPGRSWDCSAPPTTPSARRSPSPTRSSW